jgi:hypothetical protein
MACGEVLVGKRRYGKLVLSNRQLEVSAGSGSRVLQWVGHINDEYFLDDSSDVATLHT